MITTNQMNLINKMKGERNLPITDIANLTKQQASAEIKRLQNITIQNVNTTSTDASRPITQGQIEKLLQLAEELNLNPNIAVIRSWSAGKASQQIQKLIDMGRRQVREFATEAQILLIKDMLECEDIRQEEIDMLFDINTDIRERLQQQHKFLLKNDSSHPDIRELQDRIVEENHRIADLIENYDYSTLDSIRTKEFLDRNQSTFYKWKNTRATDAQVDLILKLQNEIYSINGWVANVDDQLASLDGNAFSTDESAKYIKDESYSIENTLTRDDVKKFSREYASKYIKNLQKERAETYPSTIEPEDDRQPARNIISQEVADEKDRRIVIDIIYGLNAMTGVGTDENDINGAENADEYIIDVIEQAMLYGGGIEAITDYIQDRTNSLNKHIYTAMKRMTESAEIEQQPTVKNAIA